MISSGANALKIGLIAGGGVLPALVAQSAMAMGYRVVTLALTDAAGDALQPHCEKVYRCGIGEVGRALESFRAEAIDRVVIVGRVDKQVIFSRPKFDLRALAFLRMVRRKSDDHIMAEIARGFEKEGMRILDQRSFLRELCPGPGILTVRPPAQEEWKDIAYGFALAKRIGELEIGQTVVVKDQAVLAVEAIEGTDQAISRGCALGEKGAVVVKVSRPGQDMRWDVPTVGTRTIEQLIAGKGAVLAIEAEYTLVVNTPAVVEMANEAGLAVVAVDEQSLRDPASLK